MFSGCNASKCRTGFPRVLDNLENLENDKYIFHGI